MLVLLTYLGIGIGLATAGLCVPCLNRKVDDLAGRLGMDISYARAAWFGGTAVAWPIGLYVLVTGRLILVEKDLRKPDGDASMKAKPEVPLSTETGG